MKQKHILMVSLLAAFLLLSIIPVARILSDKPLFPGTAPYYHIRMASYIKENNIPSEDPLVKKPYIPQPYHLLLILDPVILSILLPLLAGLLSTIIFYLILKELKIDKLTTSVILLTLILSPLFIYLFATSNQYSIITLLLLLGFYFFIKENYYYLIPSILIFAAMPFFGVLPSIIGLAAPLIYSLNNKSKLRYFYAILSANILILLAYQLPFLYHYGFPFKTRFISTNILTNLISDLGSSIGFGIFNLLLAIVGLAIVWKIKKQIEQKRFYPKQRNC